MRHGTGEIINRRGTSNLYIRYRINGKQIQEATGTTNRAVAEKLLRARIPIVPDYPAIFIYFIKAQKTGSVKIGISAMPEDRVTMLQTACPDDLSLTATAEFRSSQTARAVERNLHLHFQHLRVHGEWFEPDKELEKLIHDVQSGKEDLAWFKLNAKQWERLQEIDSHRKPLF